MTTQIYLRPNQYEILGRLMSATPWPTRFPVNCIDSAGLYYTKREDIYIKTPASLILLSDTQLPQLMQLPPLEGAVPSRPHPDDVAGLLAGSKTVILRNNVENPGWWYLEEESTP